MMNLLVNGGAVEAGQSLSATIVVTNAETPVKIKELHVCLESNLAGLTVHQAYLYPIDQSVPIVGDEIQLPFQYPVPAEVIQSVPLSIPGVPDVRISYTLYVRVVMKGFFSSDEYLSSPVVVVKGPAAAQAEAILRAKTPITTEFPVGTFFARRRRGNQARPGGFGLHHGNSYFIHMSMHHGGMRGGTHRGWHSSRRH